MEEEAARKASSSSGRPSVLSSNTQPALYLSRSHDRERGSSDLEFFKPYLLFCLVSECKRAYDSLTAVGVTWHHPNQAMMGKEKAKEKPQRGSVQAAHERFQGQNTEHEHIMTWNARPNCASSEKCRRGVKGGQETALWVHEFRSKIRIGWLKLHMRMISEKLTSLQSFQVPTGQTRRVHSTKHSTSWHQTTNLYCSDLAEECCRHAEHDCCKPLSNSPIPLKQRRRHASTAKVSV